MHFYYLGCGHASVMFGFVKDVFMSCAKEWGEETLMKQLDCVKKIFQGSEDLKGKELHVKADVLCTNLVTKMIPPSDACLFIFQFFSESTSRKLFFTSFVTVKWLSRPGPILAIVVASNSTMGNIIQLLMCWWLHKTKNSVHATILQCLPIIICWELWKSSA